MFVCFKMGEEKKYVISLNAKIDVRFVVDAEEDMDTSVQNVQSIPTESVTGPRNISTGSQQLRRSPGRENTTVKNGDILNFQASGSGLSNAGQASNVRSVSEDTVLNILVKEVAGPSLGESMSPVSETISENVMTGLQDLRSSPAKEDVRLLDEDIVNVKATGKGLSNADEALNLGLESEDSALNDEDSALNDEDSALNDLQNNEPPNVAPEDEEPIVICDTKARVFQAIKRSKEDGICRQELKSDLAKRGMDFEVYGKLVDLCILSLVRAGRVKDEDNLLKVVVGNVKTTKARKSKKK